MHVNFAEHGGDVYMCWHQCQVCIPLWLTFVARAMNGFVAVGPWSWVMLCRSISSSTDQLRHKHGTLQRQLSESNVIANGRLPLKLDGGAKVAVSLSPL